MQTILDYAAAKTGFVERHPTGYPELVLGSAPGMPQAVGWVFRSYAYFTLASGTPEQAVESFGRLPLRALEADGLGRFPVGSAWIVRELVARLYANSPLRRIVAVGDSGEASILFEGPAIGQERLVSLQRVAVDKTLRAVVEAIAAVDNVEQTCAFNPRARAV